MVTLAGDRKPNAKPRTLVDENGIPITDSTSKAVRILSVDSNGNIVSSVFGKPTLQTDGTGIASWVKNKPSPYFQKGMQGYLAKLTGGAQSGDDWGAVYIPVNELLLTDFLSGMWTYYVDTEEAYGVNMVIWAHDPTDLDRRVEITQAPSGTSLDKAAGWNDHVLNMATTQWFYYGEGTTDVPCSCQGTQYSYDLLKAHKVFQGWTIYRISLEWGWYSTGTFTDAYVAEVKLNGEVIKLGPSIEELLYDMREIDFETAVVKNFDAAGAYAADDVMSDDVCTTTSPSEYWTFTNMAREKGGYGRLDFASLFLETENQEPRIDLLLFNAVPTGSLTDNVANTNPVKADISSYLGRIEFPATNKEAATVASTSEVSPSSVGGLPIKYKCAAGSTTLYGVTVTRTAVTLTANDDCRIALKGVHL